MMNKVLAALALTAAMASAAVAQPAVRYYNTIPSSQAPTITNDPSPRSFSAGDYIDPDPRIDFQLLGDPPNDR